MTALRWAALVAVVAGCAQKDYEQCSSGLLCPAPKQCAEPSGLCVSEAQLAACEGKPEGAGCSLQPAQSSLNSAWAVNAMDVYAIGDAGTVLHYDGVMWSLVDAGLTSQLNGVWASDAANVFAVGDEGTIARFDGAEWSIVPADTVEALEAVTGAGGEVWAVGDLYVGRFDGARFAAVTTGLGPTNATAAWASAANDVWIATDTGEMLHFDGTWQLVDTGAGIELTSVWGTSASDVYAVGEGGTIVHYDGMTWTAMSSPTTRNLEEVSGRDPTAVFAVGAMGTLLHFDGTAWSTVASGATANLNSITLAGLEGFGVGEGGAIIEGDDLDWSSAVIDGRCTYRVCVRTPEEP